MLDVTGLGKALAQVSTPSNEALAGSIASFLKRGGLDFLPVVASMIYRLSHRSLYTDHLRPFAATTLLDKYRTVLARLSPNSQASLLSHRQLQVALALSSKTTEAIEDEEEGEKGPK